MTGLRYGVAGIIPLRDLMGSTMYRRIGLPDPLPRTTRAPDGHLEPEPTEMDVCGPLRSVVAQGFVRAAAAILNGWEWWPTLSGTPLLSLTLAACHVGPVEASITITLVIRRALGSRVGAA